MSRPALPAQIQAQAAQTFLALVLPFVLALVAALFLR